MKRAVLALALLLPFAVAAQEAPTPVKFDPFVNADPTAAATKATACFACHGPGGNGAINPQWPKLAGQHAAYIHAQLTDFKCGSLPADQRVAAKCVATRNNPVMYGQVANLSDDDMRQLGAYFASQKPVPGVGSKDAVATAEKIYRGGDASRGLPACAACHGPNGAGNSAAEFPRVSGQNADYAANELKLYRTCGLRSPTDPPCDRGDSGKGQMMAQIAAKLTDPEIAALGSYLSGLQ